MFTWLAKIVCKKVNCSFNVGHHIDTCYMFGKCVIINRCDVHNVPCVYIQHVSGQFVFIQSIQ